METHADHQLSFGGKLTKRAGKGKRDKGYRTITHEGDFDGDDDGDQNLLRQDEDSLNNSQHPGSSGSRSATPVSLSAAHSVSGDGQRQTSQFYTSVTTQQQPPLFSPVTKQNSTGKASSSSKQPVLIQKTHTVSSVSTSRRQTTADNSPFSADIKNSKRLISGRHPSLVSNSHDASKKPLGDLSLDSAGPGLTSRDPFRLLKPAGGAEVAATKRKNSGSSNYYNAKLSTRQNNSSSKTSTSSQFSEKQFEVFGVPLLVALERQPVLQTANDHVVLPAFVRELVAALEDRGLETEGLYRISGSNSKKAELRSLINKACYRTDPARQPLDLMPYDPTVLADVLKQWLRELPEPIIPVDVQKKLRDPCDKFERKGVAESVGKIRHLLATTMPECNFYLLAYVFIHMSHVLLHSRANKMSVLALGTILDPVMKIGEGRILVVLLEHAEEIFHGVDYRPHIRPAAVSTTKFLSPSAAQAAAATSRGRLASLSSRTSVTADLPERKDALEKEIIQHEAMLMRLHSIIKHKPDDKELNEQLWDKQRYVTALKRKLKELQRKQGPQSKLQSIASVGSAVGDADAAAKAAPMPKNNVAVRDRTQISAKVSADEAGGGQTVIANEISVTPSSTSAIDLVAERRRVLREIHYQFRMEDILLDEMHTLQAELKREQDKLRVSQTKSLKRLSKHPQKPPDAEPNTSAADTAERNRLIRSINTVVQRCDKYEERNSTLRSQIMQESDITASSRAWILTDKYKEYDEDESSASDDVGNDDDDFVGDALGELSDSDVVDANGGASASAATSNTHIQPIPDFDVNGKNSNGSSRIASTATSTADAKIDSTTTPVISAVARETAAASRTASGSSSTASNHARHINVAATVGGGGAPSAPPVLRTKPEVLDSRLKRQKAAQQQGQYFSATNPPSTNNNVSGNSTPLSNSKPAAAVKTAALLRSSTAAGSAQQPSAARPTPYNVGVTAATSKR